MIAETIKAILAQAKAEIKEIDDALRQKAIQREKERAKTNKESLQDIEDESLTKEDRRKKAKELYLQMISDRMDLCHEIDDAAEEAQPRIDAIKEKFNKELHKAMREHSEKIRKWATEGDLAETIASAWNVKKLGKAHLNAVQSIASLRAPELRIDNTGESAYTPSSASDFMPMLISLTPKGVEHVLDSKKKAKKGEIIINLNTLRHAAADKFVEDKQGMAKELGVSGTVLIGYKMHAYI